MNTSLNTLAPALSSLKACADIASLRPALHALCQSFGTLKRLDILQANQSGQRQALCFLRMDSLEQEQELMGAWGIGRFGGELVVIVDLPGGSNRNVTSDASAQRCIPAVYANGH